MDGHWPDGIPREPTVDALVQVFQAEGFQLSDNPALEVRFEKVAIYGRGHEYTHAARQLPDGTWTSKIGFLQDIVHATLDVLMSKEYGSVVRILKKPKWVVSSRTGRLSPIPGRLFWLSLQNRHSSALLAALPN